jgi:SAM-dependent methyltransferase/3-polyprenyl-4-hydroxybenzoate decarboxylase
VIRAYDRGDDTTIVGADGASRRFSGDSAALVRAILEFVAIARTPAELLAHLSTLAEAEVKPEGAVEEALALLLEAGAVRRNEPVFAARRSARTRLVLGLAGGVAAANAPALCELLLARGYDVRVCATPSALRFVSALALEALTHQRVVTSRWPRDPREPVPHLDLAGWADIMVVWPATATSIARIAQGSCATVVSAAAISTRAPVLIVPSMNEAMFTAPSVQRNLEQLREDGFFVAHPACGIEVAEAPEDRRPMFGAAPPLPAVMDLIEAIAAEHVKRPPAWDEIYRTRRADELPWATDALDADLAAILDGAARGTLLDVGTGLGTAAIAAADRGFSVVATDVSPHALALARQRAGARSIVWIHDDVLDTRLGSAFDVVLDRGVLHLLPRARHREWAASMRRLVRPGGTLILKCHAPGDDVDRGTTKLTREDVTALLGDAFDLTHTEDSVFSGPPGHAAKAITIVLRKRGEESLAVVGVAR